MEINIKKVCRVCLSTDSLMSVFKVNISKKIMSCTSIQVWPGDGLPSQICNKCVAKLHIAYQFKRLCEKSDSKLREFLLKSGEHSHDSINKNELSSGKSNDAISVEVPVAPADNMYIECVSITQSNVISGEEQQHISFPVDDNLECHNAGNLVQVQYNDLYQLPVQLESTQATLPYASVEILPTANQPNHGHMKLEKSDLDKSAPDTQCKVCGKVLHSLSKLNRHMNTHSSEPPFKCTICLKGFTHSGNFKVHMRMHNDEKPYKCDTCGHSCRQQQDIDKHMRTHTGERPHACHLCTKAFATRSNLVAHIRTHTGERPYVCCVCQKAFCQSNELTKHMRTHTGEKSHICDVCQKGFNSSSALITHRRSHTGEKPYSCGVCDKSYTQLYALKTHMKVHDIVNNKCNSNCIDDRKS